MDSDKDVSKLFTYLFELEYIWWACVKMIETEHRFLRYSPLRYVGANSISTVLCSFSSHVKSKLVNLPAPRKAPELSK